jgi:DHA1 family bicyclomycin/chloramphenicol resistance-like MFS transporter
MFGTMMGFLNSFQQILADQFGAADRLPLLFSIVAGAMIVGSYVNSRIVEGFGTRRVSHTGLILFISLTAIHSIVALDGHESIATLVGFQAAQMFSFALTGANFSAMAMEPVGHIAGTASSTQGVISTVIGAVLGLAIGQSFDGTTLPLVVGGLICALLAFLTVVVTEKGKLFRPLHGPVGFADFH